MLTQQLNLTPQRAKNTVNDLPLGLVLGMSITV